MSTPEEDAAAESSTAISDRVRFELAVRRLVDEELAKTGKPDSKDDGFLRHPATLVVLTFLLTGVFGTLLTTIWQAQQWARQQNYRAAEQATKERLSVMTFANQSVAETFTAAEDVLYLFSYDIAAESRAEVVKQRSTKWTASSSKWRIDEKVLVTRVQANFKDAAVTDRLTDICRARRFLGNDVTNLLSLGPAETARIEEKKGDALAKINTTTGAGGSLAKLNQAMLAEIQRRDAKVDVSMWTVLRQMF